MKRTILMGFIFFLMFSMLNIETSHAVLGSPPGVPNNFVVSSQTSTSITLTWNVSGGATSYYLSRMGFGLIFSGNATTYTDTGLTPGTTYNYSLYAKNSSGSSAITNASGTTSGNVGTPSPTNVHVVSKDSTDVTLGWDTMTGATSYQVTRNGTTVYTGNATTFSDTGLSPNTAYTYNVYTIDSNGTSAASNINVTTDPGSLSITNIPSSLNFGSISIDGTTHSVPVSMGTIEVSDTTGTNSGWNVTMSATPFTSSTDASIKLPVNSFTVNGISQINRVSGSTNMPVSLVSSPLSVDNGTVKIVQAAAGNGAGVYDIVFPVSAFTVIVDTSKKLISSGTSQTIFHSIITFTLNVGP